MLLSFIACVCVHRQGSHFYKHPQNSASQNAHLLEKVMERVIGNTVEIAFLCTKVMRSLNWGTRFPMASSTPTKWIFGTII